MRKIIKGQEPPSLGRWKRNHSGGNYQDLSYTERQDIREACAKEQYYLCAYCCAQISGQPNDTVNEHVKARDLAPQSSLDFNNIVASCKTPKQCDDAHGNQVLPLTPLMDECETELYFYTSGRVKGSNDRASESIRVLNLGDNEQNNKALVEKRKNLADALLWINGVYPNQGLEDASLIQLLIDDIAKPKDGKLEPFAPVVANILKRWLKDSLPKGDESELKC